MATSSLKKKLSLPISKDIRFWIILYFLIRLFHITQPPLEIAHNWRQSTGLMVSRNFYEINSNIIYPRVDMAGEKSGITGTEFPLFNYFIFLTAKIFGWSDWYGRLINLIISSLGVYWFYLLIYKYINPKVAFYSGFILLNSLWFAYSRKTMPDTFSVSLVLGGLLFALEYLKKDRIWRLFAFFILVLAGLLSKIPSGYLLICLVIPFLDKNIPIIRKLIVGLLFIIIIIPVGWWYFIWVPFLVKEYGFWHYYMGTSFINGAKEISDHLDQAIEKFYFAALNFIGFSLFLGGLILSIIRKKSGIIWVFCLCFASFFVFILKAGFAFYHHNYYIIPFVPVMALMAGYCLSEIKQFSVRRILVLAVATEVILNSLPEFHTNKDQKYKLTLENLAAKYSSPHDLIAINCGPNPQQIYLAHRKGWNLENADQTKFEYLQSIKKKGCKILIINKHEAPVFSLPYKVLEDNPDFIVYDL